MLDDAEWMARVTEMVGPNVPPHSLPPRRIYRFFSKVWEAEALCRGQVYLSTLSRCRAYENVRQGDAGEAIHTFSVSEAKQGHMPESEFQFLTERLGMRFENCTGGEVTASAGARRMRDALLLCCTSVYEPELFRKDFGRRCVEIRDSVAFFKVVSERLEARLAVKEGRVGPVAYSTREYRDSKRELAPLGFVKPDSYADQREVRMLWEIDGALDGFPGVVVAPEVVALCRRVA